MYRVKSAEIGPRNRRVGRVLPVAIRIASEGMGMTLGRAGRSWSRREVTDRLSNALTRSLVSVEPEVVAEVRPELEQVASQLAFCWNPPLNQGEL